MKTRPPFALLLAVAVLSSAVLGFEIALTRVFAVLLRYHFAFLVISIAVCGLGIGGYAAYWLRRKRAVSLPAVAALLAISIVLALALMLRVIFAHFPEAYGLAAALVLIPFSFAGAFLAEVFARYSHWSGRLYAWDLAGAALAAFAIVGVLQVLSAIDACLLMGALAAVAGVLAARTGATSSPPLTGGVRGGGDAKLQLSNAPSRRPKGTRLPRGEGDSSADTFREHGDNGIPKSGADALLVGVAILVFIGLNVKFRFLDIPAVPPRADATGATLADKNVTQPLFTELGTPGHTSKIVDTRWSAFARTDVVLDASMPGSFYLYTNGNVPTNMMQWDGKLSSIGAIANLFSLSDWAFAVAPLQTKNSSVLSIGPGGGLDALLALHHGAKKFDGAEINPSIVELMNEPPYKKFNGGIYARDDVHVVVADGRAFVREAIVKNKKYSLLFSALTKTATAGTGLALLESFIYTTDAFKDYLDVLQDNGQITIVLDNPVLTARFAATALDVFQSRGVDAKTAMQHLAIVHDERPGPYVFALVIQKTPFTRAQTFQMEDAVLKRGLDAIWIPNQAQSADYGPYPQLASGAMDLPGFIAMFRNFEQPLDISPCPDGRPFVLDLSLETLPVFKQLTIFALVLALGVLAISWRTAGEELPTSNVQRRTSNVEQGAQKSSTLDVQSSTFDVLYILYFLALGIGFMLVEIPLAQKLILPLGYPTLALTVILFSILLGGGAGAWFSQRFEGEKLRQYALGCAVGVALMTALGVLLLPAIGAALLPLPIVLRCVLAALLILPLGFLLGTPFPSGLRLFAAQREGKVPLIWGLNGVASVVGSLLSAMGAKNFGFGAMMATGATIYLVAGLLLKMTSERQGGRMKDEG